jgi:RHS repeat-associated protein
MSNTVFQQSGPSVQIGPKSPLGLSFTFRAIFNPKTISNPAVIDTPISYEGAIKHVWNYPQFVTVTVMGKNENFTQSGSTWGPSGLTGGTLVQSGSNFTYTDKDGVVTQFTGLGTGASWITDALPSTTTFPNGLTVTYSWITASGGFYYYLTSVNNNAGYQLKFNRNGADLQKIIALNNAVEFCPLTTNCTPSHSWPTITVSLTVPPPHYNYHITATDSLGHVWTYATTDTQSGVGAPIYVTDEFTQPTGQVIDHIYQIDPWTGDYSNWEVTIGGNTWYYGIDYSSYYPYVSGDSYDPNGVSRQIVSDPTTQLPVSDALDPSGINSAMNWWYDADWRLNTIQDRSYNFTGIGYTNNWAVNYESKTGTGNSLSTTATYSTSCSGSTYKYCNKPTYIVDGNGNQTDFTYDTSSGNVATVEGAPPSSGAPRPLTTYSYSAHYAWYYTSTGGGSFTQGPAIYLPDEVDTCVGSRSSCSGSNMRKTTFTYESGSSSVGSNLEQLTVTTQIDGATCPSSDCSTVTSTYDEYGNVTSTSVPNSTSVKTVFFYDGDQRQVGSVQPVSGGGGTSNYATTKTSYDDSNRVLQAEQGYTISQSRYDFDNNFTSMVQSANSYDSNTGALIKTVGSIGGTAQSVKQYEYDAGGRLSCTAIRQNASVFGSLPGACTQSTTGSYGPDLITQNHYDVVNRITSVDTGVGSGAAITSLTNHYDSYGRLDWVQDGKGNRSGYTYDVNNRLSQLNFPDPSSPNTISSTDYEGYGYDTFGNLTSKRLRSNDTFTMYYDGLERLSRRQEPSGSPLGDIYYTYDLVGDPLSICRCSSGTPDLGYTWDALSRKTSETSYSHTISSQYDAAGNRTRLTYPDSNYVDYSYDYLNRTYQVKESGSTVLAQYAYDDLGRTTGISRANSTSTSASYGGSSRSWSLTQDLASTGQDVTLGMDYSPGAQLAQRSINNSNYRYQNTTNSTTNYCANGLNQYATVGGSSGSCSGGTSYTYDARGNLTSDGSRSLGYDYDNELTCVGSSCATMSLAYDPAGRLRTTTASSATENYVYDGDALVVEYDNSGNILRRYVPGQGADETLVWYEGSNLSNRNMLHTDEQGSIIAASDGSGVGTLYQYSATGEPQGGFSGGGPIFRYTGQAQLPAAGLYYYKARVYDPSMGRFLQTDPAGYSQGLNLYAYVMNNYPNAVDPLGLKCIYVRDGEWQCDETVTWTGTKDPSNSGSAGGASSGVGPSHTSIIGFDANVETVNSSANRSRTNSTPFIDPHPIEPEGSKAVRCLGEAISKNKVAFAADIFGLAASFVPGGGALWVGSQLALASGSTIFAAATTAPSAAMGIAVGTYAAGYGVTSLELAKVGASTARLLPVAGLFISGYQLYNDLTPDYDACMLRH